MASDSRDEYVTEAIGNWLQTLVIDLNFCPFAKKVWVKRQVHISVCHAHDPQAILRHLFQEIADLLSCSAEQRDTSIVAIDNDALIYPLYLDVLAEAEYIIEQEALDGVVQIASFHPDYVFAGEPASSPSHYTNRAPFPLFHILREDSVTRAVDLYPDASQIPENNIRTCETLGKAVLAERLAACLNTKKPG